MRDEPTPYLFAEFARLVEETAFWCALRADPRSPATSLRSPTLDPGVCFTDREPGPWSGETREFRFLEDVETVGRLAERRRAAIAGATPHASRAEEGRILLFWPNDTLSSEATHPASDGLFALSGDLPPWDTWIAYFIAARSVVRACWDRPDPHRLDLLACWIPNVFVRLVDRGLDASEIPLGEWAPSDTLLSEVHAHILGCLGYSTERPER